MKRVPLHVCIAALILYSGVVWAAEPPDEGWVRTYDCRRTTGPIVVDGVGNEIAWQLAPDLGEFTWFNPPEARRDETMAPERTTVRMLWDEDNLYFLITVWDKDIYSTITERDVTCLCHEETIEIFIDPDGDALDYAEIHMNCLGTINDIWIPRQDFKTHAGDPVTWDDLYAWTQEGMRYAVMNHGSINDGSDEDRGSVFEFSMPWAGFGKIAGSAATPPAPGDAWRINVNRYERPTREKENLSGWAPLFRTGYHYPERFGYINFIGGE